MIERQEKEHHKVYNKWIKALRQNFLSFQNFIETQFKQSFKELNESLDVKYQGIIDQKDQKIKELQQNLDKYFQIQQLLGGGGPIVSKTDSKTTVESNQVNKGLLNKQNNFPSEEANSQRIISQRKESKNQNQKKPPSQKRKVTKDPIKSNRDHSLQKISLRPNFTPISFIQYEQAHNKRYAFADTHIQYLEQHDISKVESIKISFQQMTNQVFVKLTKLQWNNIISLQVDQNLLTNLDPLRNLPFRRLVHLDVSLNDLDIQSAKLLSTLQFDELIYFTVSFKTGINDKCWDILLKDNMENFPKLQALDVCNSNQLKEITKEKIVSCLRLKSANQRQNRKTKNDKGQIVPYYPDDYQIKIKWQLSKEISNKISKKQLQMQSQKWRNEVDYKNQPLQVPCPKKRRIIRKKRSKKGSKKSKNKSSVRQNHRIRGRPRGRGNSRVQKITNERIKEQEQKSEINRNEESMSVSVCQSKRKMIQKDI